MGVTAGGNAYFQLTPEQNINIPDFGCFLTEDKGDHIMPCK